MKKENIFWGIFLIGCAALLLISKLGFDFDFNIFTVLLTVLFAGWIVKSVIHRDFAGIPFPVAFLCILYSDFLGLDAITPWPVLAAALLVTIGISMMYHPRHRINYSHDCGAHYNDGNGNCANDFNEDVSNVDGEELQFSTRFGSSIKYIKSENLKRVDVDASFGGMKIYFDEARLAQDIVQINVHSSFSGVELYIPKTWRVENQISLSCSGVDEKNMSCSTGSPKVVMTGEANFSGITIIYV